LKCVKIIDFGVSGIGNALRGEKSTACTLAYAAPELLSGKNIESNPKLDIWSLGVILYLLVTKRKPFGHEATTDYGLFDAIQNDDLQFPKYPKLSRPLRNLLK